MVIDALVHHFTRGRRGYDADARMASRGHVLPALLKTLFAKIFAPASAQVRWPRAIRQSLCRENSRLGTPPPRASRGSGSHRNRVHRALHLRGPASLGPAANPARAAHRLRRRRAQSAAPGAAFRACGGIEVIASEALGLPGDASEERLSSLTASETLHGRPANSPAPPALRVPPSSAKSAIPRPASFVL